MMFKLAATRRSSSPVADEKGPESYLSAALFTLFVEKSGADLHQILAGTTDAGTSRAI